MKREAVQRRGLKTYPGLETTPEEKTRKVPGGMLQRRPGLQAEL